MKKELIALIAAAAALGGCAGQDVLSVEMAGFEHDRVDTAIDAWGDPEERVAVGDGELLTWRDRAGDAYSGGTAPVVCVRMLAVGPDGTITGWRWRGDGCPSVDTNRAGYALVAASSE